MTCAACFIDDRTKECELVNGSTMAFCQPCRVRFDEIITAVPIDGGADMRAEEAAQLEGRP